MATGGGRQPTFRTAHSAPPQRGTVDDAPGIPCPPTQPSPLTKPCPITQACPPTEACSVTPGEVRGHLHVLRHDILHFTGEDDGRVEHEQHHGPNGDEEQVPRDLHGASESPQEDPQQGTCTCGTGARAMTSGFEITGESRKLPCTQGEGGGTDVDFRNPPPPAFLTRDGAGVGGRQGQPGGQSDPNIWVSK